MPVSWQGRRAGGRTTRLRLKIGVGLVGAFAAREVFVSTLGITYSVQQAATMTTPNSTSPTAWSRPSTTNGTPMAHRSGTPDRPHPAGLRPCERTGVSTTCWWIAGEAGGWRWAICASLEQRRAAWPGWPASPSTRSQVDDMNLSDGIAIAHRRRLRRLGRLAAVPLAAPSHRLRLRPLPGNPRQGRARQPLSG